ncbi:EAL domain-containing protein [Caulobacter sp. S45]|uniref:flagella assembly cyclic-di-GMP phosphodiesterase TipF n=1 Tax=Caulobacter sp. S45 TaxID=1641861 RepID=UPI00131BF778|nr:EAL domain-containing protein [Caulobacter sp. S45]
MRKLAAALLSCAYIFAAFAVAALVWRGGGGWGAGFSALAGALGFAFALHALIGRTLDGGAMRREIAALREAHQILADHIEDAQTAMEVLGRAVQTESAERAEAIVSEVRMLEDLVAHMGETLTARLDARGPVGAGAASVGGGRGIDRQRATLLETVREALAENRVDLYLQPVVSLPQRRTMFYESFTRLRDASGRVMMPAEYLTVAEPEGLVQAIDNLLLFRCVQIVRRLAENDRKVGIFCNISLASLGDDAFFPRFLDFMAQNRDLSGALIFELGQRAFRERGARESRNMAKLADLGFRFSMDKVSDLDLDYPDLARADVKFLKIGAETLLREMTEVDGRAVFKSVRDLDAADFVPLLSRYGVEVIAEKIEAERQVIDVLELDVVLGQGHLFGEPRPIRDAVIAETAPPAEFMRGSLRRAAR